MTRSTGNSNTIFELLLALLSPFALSQHTCMKPQCTRLGDYGDYGDSVVSDACSISYEPTHIGRHQQGRCFRSSLFRHPRGRPLLKALIHRLGTSRSERSGVSTFRRASPTMRLHATNYSLGVALIMRAAAATPIAPTAAELGSCCTRTQVRLQDIENRAVSVYLFSVQSAVAAGSPLGRKVCAGLQRAVVVLPAPVAARLLLLLLSTKTQRIDHLR